MPTARHRRPFRLRRHEGGGVLRALVAVLLLANVAFFAWTSGWLDSVAGARAIGDREPERLARQVSPEIVRILPTSAGTPALASDSTEAMSDQPACFEAGPFNDADLTAAQSAVQSVLPAGSWTSVKTDHPSVWIVYMGKYANRESLNRKEDELKRRKLDFEEVLDHPTLALGISLGRYDDRPSAGKAIEQFEKQGIHTARVAELSPASTTQMLRVEKADAAVSAQVASLKSDALGKGFTPCAKTSTN